MHDDQACRKRKQNTGTKHRGKTNKILFDTDQYYFIVSVVAFKPPPTLRREGVDLGSPAGDLEDGADSLTSQRDVLHGRTSQGQPFTRQHDE